MKRSQILSAATALLLVATAAEAQKRQDDRRGHDDHREQAAPPAQQRSGVDNRQRAVDPRQRSFEQTRAGQPGVAPVQDPRRAPQFDERQRDLQARQREEAAEHQRAEQLEAKQRLLDAQRRAQVNRAYERDARLRYDYRYKIGGLYRETNQYGVDVLRQAVNMGYQQGYRAGQLDLRDRVAPNYQRAFEYQNGTFGYTPNYVPQGDYTYYFREGFQRGYDDAYGNQLRYGTFSNGSASILGDIVTGILGLTSIR